MINSRACTLFAIVGGMTISHASSAQRTVAAGESATKRAANSARAMDELLSRPVTLTLNHVSLTQAIDAAAASARVLVQYQVAVVEAYAQPVTIRVKKVPLREALESILAGTRLRVIPDGTTQLTVVDGAPGADSTAQTGLIAGVVTSAKTKQPVKGATILLDKATRGVVTNGLGRYVLSVPVGVHTITVKYIGYNKYSRTVTVASAATTTFDIALEPSTNQLDQVVVTGTVVATELKAIPNAITVITAKQIEQRGVTQIQQLFRGDVPGLFAQQTNYSNNLDGVEMFSRGATALSMNSAGTTGYQSGHFSNVIKTYVDGVELADPKYLSQIDPKSIERIEILTGPQASTIYGANAINGVMQIFTKRGTASRPQLSLTLLSGWVENSANAAHAPQHDYAAQLSGVEGRLSYNVGTSWNYKAPWTGFRQTAVLGGFGGARLEIPTMVGPVTADATIRRTATKNRQVNGGGIEMFSLRETGLYNPNDIPLGLAPLSTQTLVGQTLGLNFTHAPRPWWSYELGYGQDVSEAVDQGTGVIYRWTGDTTLVYSMERTTRRSLRTSTTVRVPITSLAQATITGGGDGWEKLSEFNSTFNSRLSGTGNIANSSTSMYRTPSHNAGAFVQGQLAILNQLFLTYGLRAEWSPGFGADVNPTYAPRVGAAYTRDIGMLTAKVRASYGRATRLPASNAKSALTPAEAGQNYLIPYYGVFNLVAANPELSAEYQKGGEVGVELYFGTRASLVVTRYNQTVDALIDYVELDSARSIVKNPPYRSSLDAEGYGYYPVGQYLNLGTIRNQGWELQGSTTTGSFTTKGTYTWSKSRTIGVDPKYALKFPANIYPQFQKGATFRYLPEHTWAASVTYARARTTMGITMNGIGQIKNHGNEMYSHHLDDRIRLMENRWRVTYAFTDMNKAYVMADFMAAQRISAGVEGVVQIANLTDYYQADYEAGGASMGRQTKVGLRLRLP